MTSQDAVASVSLPLHPTPPFPQGLRGGRATGAPDSYKTYDFLKGEAGTPAAPERYYDPIESKRPGYKPGWNTMRPQAVIKQDAERVAAERQREERKQVHEAARREHVRERELCNAFNPITGQEYNRSTGSWQEATNPWQHRNPTLRPVATIVAKEGPLSAAGTNTNPIVGNNRVEMRKARIATDGLTTTRKPAGVKELLQWQS